MCDGTQNVERYRYFFRYQIFSIPIPVLFSGTKFFRYRFRDFFRYQIFPIPVPRLFSGTNIFRYRYRYHQKNEKFPVLGISGTGTSHSAWKCLGSVLGPGVSHLLISANIICSALRRKQRRTDPKLYPSCSSWQYLGSVLTVSWQCGKN